LSEMSFLLSVFAIVEHARQTELTTTSKKLIIAYIKEAPELETSDKARAAVHRYADIVLPSLDAIRKKSTTAKLDKLDHLVLKMEYEASRLSL